MVAGGFDYLVKVRVRDMNARVRSVVPQMDDRARLMAYARELGAR